ncbi:hypothetical protein R1flu_022458 [Riccia fluitans]|uniref:Uncharacterized protein n=1 Tax=Riccia fluitans TaxID=41844 RepID=A0ABD1XS95_9MARC
MRKEKLLPMGSNIKIFYKPFPQFIDAALGPTPTSIAKWKVLVELWRQFWLSRNRLVYEGQKGDTTVWLCARLALDKCILKWWDEKDPDDNSFALCTVLQLITHIPEGKFSILHQKILEKQRDPTALGSNQSLSDVQTPILTTDSTQDDGQDSGEVRHSTTDAPTSTSPASPSKGTKNNSQKTRLRSRESRPFPLLTSTGCPSSTNLEATREAEISRPCTPANSMLPTTPQPLISSSHGPIGSASQDKILEAKGPKSSPFLPQNSELNSGEENLSVLQIKKSLHKQRPSFRTVGQRRSTEAEELNPNNTSAQRTEHYTGDVRPNTLTNLRPSANSLTIANLPTRAGPDAGEIGILRIDFLSPCPLSSGREFDSAPDFTHGTRRHAGGSRSAPPIDPSAHPLTNALNSGQKAEKINSPAINNPPYRYSHGNPTGAEPNHITEATHELDTLAGGNRNYLTGTPTASPFTNRLPFANAPTPNNSLPGRRLPKGSFDSSTQGKLVITEELTRSSTLSRMPRRETGEILRSSSPNSLPCLPTKILATAHSPDGIPSTRLS